MWGRNALDETTCDGVLQASIASNHRNVTVQYVPQILHIRHSDFKKRTKRVIQVPHYYSNVGIILRI